MPPFAAMQDDRSKSTGCVVKSPWGRRPKGHRLPLGVRGHSTPPACRAPTELLPRVDRPYRWVKRGEGPGGDRRRPGRRRRAFCHKPVVSPTFVGSPTRGPAGSSTHTHTPPPSTQRTTRATCLPAPLAPHPPLGGGGGPLSSGACAYHVRAPPWCHAWGYYAPEHHHLRCFPLAARG